MFSMGEVSSIQHTHQNAMNTINLVGQIIEGSIIEVRNNSRVYCNQFHFLLRAHSSIASKFVQTGVNSKYRTTLVSACDTDNIFLVAIQF